MDPCSLVWSNYIRRINRLFAGAILKMGMVFCVLTALRLFSRSVVHQMYSVSRKPVIWLHCGRQHTQEWHLPFHHSLMLMISYERQSFSLCPEVIYTSRMPQIPLKAVRWRTLVLSEMVYSSVVHLQRRNGVTTAMYLIISGHDARQCTLHQLFGEDIWNSP